MSSADPKYQGLSEDEILAARWDTVAFRAQGSPFEDIGVACLARNAGKRGWSRSPRVKGDTVGRYVYLSFEELIEAEKLDRKSAVLLLEILETTFLFEGECEQIGGFSEVDEEASQQRLRLVEQFGLYRDFPIQFGNFGPEFLELCAAEDVATLLDLMGFLDRLSDKAWMGGAFQRLQNIFAHGDESGLAEFFPYRRGHRGFHLPESLAFCLNRLGEARRAEVFDYHERRRRRDKLGPRKRTALPEVVEDRLLPEIHEIMAYFGRRQSRSFIRWHDSAYLSRELMHLGDPQTERVLHWLVHLALGVFRKNNDAWIAGEIGQMKAPQESDTVRDLREMLKSGS